MERLPLIFSILCFLLGGAVSWAALRAGRHRRATVGMLALGFLGQTWFLWQRGVAIGHCPLTNLFEVLTFLCWSVVGFYLFIGHAYRLSLLGVFTAPVVFVLQSAALVLPVDVLHLRPIPPNPWAELHGALGILAYGAFALSAVAGGMYLLQEKQLKTHHLRSFFFQMPPITTLATANLRLIATGLLFLTISLAVGIFVAFHTPIGWVKSSWGLVIWAVYFAILRLCSQNPRRVAALSIAAFVLAFAALWGMNHLVTTAVSHA